MKKLLCLLTALIMLAAASCSTPAETAANTAPASGPETAAQSAAAPADEQKYQDSDLTLWAECSASEGESIDLAKEWAVSSLSDGFANRYTLDAEYLNILNIS